MPLEWSAINYVDTSSLPTMGGWQQTASNETGLAVSAATSVSPARKRDSSVSSSEASYAPVRYNISSTDFRSTVSFPAEFQSTPAQIGSAMHATVDSSQTTEKMIVWMALDEATPQRCCTLL